MFSLKSILRKSLVTSVALVSTCRTPLLCQDQIWNSKGIGLPNFQNITPSILESKVSSEIDSFKSNLAVVNSTFSASSLDRPQETVDILERSSMPLVKNWGIVKHLMGVQNSDEIRKVQSSLQGSVVGAMQGV